MPRLKKLDISYDSRGLGSSENEASPVAGVEHLASLEEIYVEVYAKRRAPRKLESLCRGSIQRHQRYQVIKTNLQYHEYDDENSPVESSDI